MGRRHLPVLVLTLAALIVALAHADDQPTAQQLLRHEPIDALEPPVDEADFTMNAAAFARHEALGMALAGLAIFVAAGGGTGGGGILDPIYILIMKLDAKVAIPLSSITIVGGAIANLLINVRRTRKNSTTPLIDWDFILVMQPMLLSTCFKKYLCLCVLIYERSSRLTVYLSYVVGASIGTFINSIAPTWLLCILLVIVLTATGIRTLQKAISAGRQEWWFPHRISSSSERSTLVGATSSYQGGSGTTGYANGAGARSSSWKPPGARTSTASSGTAAQAQELKIADIPWRKLGALFALFAGFVALSLLQLVVPQNSFLLFIVAFLPTILLIVFSRYAMRNVLETFRKQQNPYYLLTPGEIQWTPQSIRYFPIFSILAGMISGMFGIGGGIINAPLMLEIGIDPSAASAMTATTVLFSSASTYLFIIILVYLLILFIFYFVGFILLTLID